MTTLSPIYFLHHERNIEVVSHRLFVACFSIFSSLFVGKNKQGKFHYHMFNMPRCNHSVSYSSYSFLSKIPHVPLTYGSCFFESFDIYTFKAYWSKLIFLVSNYCHHSTIFYSGANFWTSDISLMISTS